MPSKVETTPTMRNVLPVPVLCSAAPATRSVDQSGEKGCSAGAQKREYLSRLLIVRYRNESEAGFAHQRRQLFRCANPAIEKYDDECSKDAGKAAGDARAGDDEKAARIVHGRIGRRHHLRLWPHRLELVAQPAAGGFGGIEPGAVALGEISADKFVDDTVGALWIGGGISDVHEIAQSDTAHGERPSERLERLRSTTWSSG